MHLRQYLDDCGMTPAAFAGEVDRDKATVYKVLQGDASAETIRRIYKATGGRVTPNDVLGLHGLKPRLTVLDDLEVESPTTLQRRVISAGRRVLARLL